MIALRPACVGDARSIGYLSVTVWRQAYRGLVPEGLLEALSIDERSEGFEEFLASSPQNGGGGWLAFAAREPVGFALFGPARDHPDGASSGEIYALYVLKSFWGKGVGHELVEQALAHLECLGFAHTVLWVLEANARARRFYEREGFLADGGRKLDPWGGHVLDEVRYWRRTVAALPSR